MAPPLKKGRTLASASKPVVRRDGKPTRAEKSKANKTNYQDGLVKARKFKADLREVGLELHRTKGRPAPFPWSDELGAQLFELFATGRGLDQVSQIEGMPGLGVMVRWLADVKHPFTIIHTRAKALLVSLFEDRALAVALQTNEAVTETERQTLTKDGEIVDLKERRVSDNVPRSALAFAAYQWALSHLQPKKHGKQAQPDTDKPNEQLEALYQSLKAGPKE